MGNHLLDALSAAHGALRVSPSVCGHRTRWELSFFNALGRIIRTGVSLSCSAASSFPFVCRRRTAGSPGRSGVWAAARAPATSIRGLPDRRAFVLPSAVISQANKEGGALGIARVIVPGDAAAEQREARIHSTGTACGGYRATDTFRKRATDTFRKRFRNADGIETGNEIQKSTLREGTLRALLNKLHRYPEPAYN